MKRYGWKEIDPKLGSALRMGPHWLVKDAYFFLRCSDGAYISLDELVEVVEAVEEELMDRDEDVPMPQGTPADHCFICPDCTESGEMIRVEQPVSAVEFCPYCSRRLPVIPAIDSQ